MSKPVVVTATARAPPVGVRSAAALGPWGSLHAVATQSIASAAAIRAMNDSSAAWVCGILGQEPHRPALERFAGFAPTLVPRPSRSCDMRRAAMSLQRPTSAEQAISATAIRARCARTAFAKNGRYAMTTAIRLDTPPTAGTSHRAAPPQMRWTTRNHRRHWARDVARVTALVAADLGTAVSVGGLLRGVGLSGLLGGWPFPVACLLALTITGAYGPPRRRHDAGRLLGAVVIAALMRLE